MTDYAIECDVIQKGKVIIKAASLEDAVRRSKYVKAEDVTLDNGTQSVMVTDVYLYIPF